VSNCNRSLGCSGDVCGLFRITWPYWSDAGKPVIPQDHPDNEGGEEFSSSPVQCKHSEALIHFYSIEVHHHEITSTLNDS
jgi:hypothetical protein